MSSVPFSLSGIGAALGRICLDNVACAERLGLSEDWMRRRIGIDQRFVLGEGETLLGLAARAADAAMSRAGRSSVDAIVATTLTDADKSSTLASRIGSALGLKPCLATDLSAGHASFPAALLSGIGLLGVGMNSVLVVSADSLGTAAIGTEPDTALIFSDGAGAALIERDGPANYRIHAIDGGVDSSRAGLFAVRARADAPDAAHRVHMRGQALFKFVVEHTVEMLSSLCERAGRHIDDIDCVVPHQSSTRMLDVIRERAGVKAERWLTNVASIGNAGTASIPIALAGSYDGAKALPSSLALVSAGAGLSWLGVLMASIATADEA